VFERFTDRARNVIVLSQREAEELHHSYIGTEHLLLGLLREGAGVGAQALLARGISLEDLRQQVLAKVKPGPVKLGGQRPFTPRAKKALELSLREALRLDHSYIGTEHLLLGLLREEDGLAAQVLRSLGVEVEGARAQVEQILRDVQADVAAGGNRRLPFRLRSPRLPRPVALASDPAGSAPGTVEISFGRFSQVIDDPELAAALAQVSPDRLRATLRQTLLGAPEAAGERNPEA
jgi:ATP-dependent Clp protease ATP-binding subunit ClpA